jgi:hypothetical protein
MSTSTVYAASPGRSQATPRRGHPDRASTACLKSKSMTMHQPHAHNEQLIGVQPHLDAVRPSHIQVLPFVQVQPALAAVREAAATRAGNAAKHLVLVGVVHLDI